MKPTPIIIINKFIDDGVVSSIIDDGLSHDNLSSISEEMAAHADLINDRFNADLTHLSIDGIATIDDEGIPTSIPGFSFNGRQWIDEGGDELVMYVFLQTATAEYSNFNPEYSVFGGIIDFKNFNVAIQLDHGDAIVFPRRPNFVHTISPVVLGELKIIKFGIACPGWVYDRTLFESDRRNWAVN